MSAKTPTDYERAYHLARKLAAKRGREIKTLKDLIKKMQEDRILEAAAVYTMAYHDGVKSKLTKESS